MGEENEGLERKKGGRRIGGGGEYNQAKTGKTSADLRELPIKKKLHPPPPPISNLTSCLSAHMATDVTAVK